MDDEGDAGADGGSVELMLLEADLVRDLLWGGGGGGGALLRAANLFLARGDVESAGLLLSTAAQAPDGVVAGLGQRGYLDVAVGMRERPPEEPSEFARRLANLAADGFGRVPLAQFEVPVFGGGWWEEAEVGDGGGAPGGADRHNVHDHGMASGVRAAAAEVLRALGEAGGVPASGAEVVAEVESAVDYALDSGMGERLVGDCLTLVDSLGEEGFDGFGGLSERGLLASVWRHIRVCPEASDELRADMRQTLVRELAEGLEGGRPVCSTGKMARILSVYDGTDLLKVRPRPLWAVRQEIASMAARHRDAESGREAFEAEARALYVAEQGMSAAVLDPIIAEYAEHV